MKSNQITKSLTFSGKKKKITTSNYPLDQTFVLHFIKKTHIYYLECREGEKERRWFSQYTSNKMQKKKKITKGRRKKE